MLPLKTYYEISGESSIWDAKIKDTKAHFILILLILTVTPVILAQQDTISQNRIHTSNRPLQFGNELLYQNEIIILVDISMDPRFAKYSNEYAQKYLVYDPVRDSKRLLINAGVYVGVALASFGILWLFPEDVTGWDKDKIREEGLFKRRRENIAAGPAFDDDPWYVNWVAHPYAGAVHYMAARGSGFKRWESFIFSALMSTLYWEYGVEAFAEIPSIQDLILTPVLGSFIGEGFFVLKGRIIRNNRYVLNSRVLGAITLFLIDPVNQITNGLGYKTKNEIQVYSLIAPISNEFRTNQNIWGLQVAISF